MFHPSHRLMRVAIVLLGIALVLAPGLAWLPTHVTATVSASAQQMPMPLECFSVADDGNELVRMDRFTGTVTDIGPTGVSDIEAIAMSLDSNTLYAVNQNGTDGDFGTLDMTTGTFTLIGVIGSASNVDSALGTVDLDDIDSLSFDPSTGLLWGILQTPNLLFAIDPATGSFIPDIFGPGRDYAELDMSSVPGVPPQTDDLGIHPQTGEFYVIANGLTAPAGDRVVSVDIDPVNPPASPGYNATDGTISVTDIAPLTLGGADLRDMEGFSFFNDGTFMELLVPVVLLPTTCGKST